MARFFIGKGEWPLVMTFIEKPGVLFREQVIAHMKAEHGEYSPSSARFSVVMIATMPDRRARDLDNLSKASMDALTHAGIWFDDEQIDEITIKRGPVQKPGWLDVEITPRQEPTP
jgi:crossover junction endodeoxyribonuclease RusA